MLLNEKSKSSNLLAHSAHGHKREAYSAASQSLNILQRNAEDLICNTRSQVPEPPLFRKCVLEMSPDLIVTLHSRHSVGYQYDAEVSKRELSLYLA